MPKPIVNSIAPNRGKPGEKFAFVIRGRDFEQGATASCVGTSVFILESHVFSASEIRGSLLVGTEIVGATDHIRVKNPGAGDRLSNLDVEFHVEIPRDYFSRIQALAESFPSLRKATGIRPWNPEQLEAWACDRAANDESAFLAVQFILSLFEEDVGIPPGARNECGPFDFRAAMMAWDDEHRNAFIDWVKAPWWPFDR